MNNELEIAIRAIVSKAEATWKGESGIARGVAVETLLRGRLPEYAEFFGESQATVLEWWESHRRVNVVNHYQESNIPRLADILTFKTKAEFAAINPSKKYICPACDAQTDNPYECEAGTLKADGNKCDWKSYGFFKTLGKGVDILIAELGKDAPLPIHIFKPVGLTDDAVCCSS
ncbi:TPA: hypothetical protein ACGQ50_000813 [Enterobacter cloacae]